MLRQQANLPLVESLLGCGLLAQGRPVTANLWLVNTPEDVQELVALLEAPYRSLPGIVISAVNRNAWRFTPTAPGYLVNAAYLADKVKGYAIVAQISFQAAFALTEAVGKSWSVYDGACRTYFPKIDFDNGSPAHHPCNLKDKIWFWNYEGLRGERGYTAFLIDTAHRAASTNRTDWSGLYFVPDARILAAELELAHAAHLANAPERELAMQNHIAALQRKLQLTSREKRGNLTRARIRSRIEHVFGAIHQRAGDVILRTIGISMAEVKLGLRNIAYNMDRFCTLMLQNA